VVLVCYYVSLNQRSTLLQSDAQTHSLDASMPRAQAAAAKGSLPLSSSSDLAYDATVKAEVDTRLMEALAEANELQVHRLVKRQQALRAGDPVLAKPSTSQGNVRLSSQEPEHEEYKGHWEWGSVNPETGMQRLTCSDSVADSSGNGAPKNRFWGGPLVGKSSGEVQACAPGEPCNDPCARSACNVGEVYAVECPVQCLKEQLGGAVFGAGTKENPFMDLSSVCRAAIAAGVSNDKDSNIVTFKIVDPPKSYTGAPESKRQRLTTLDYKNATGKFGGGSWYGLRAFVFVPASEAIWVVKEAASGGEDGHMAFSDEQSMNGAKMVQLKKLDGGQENMAPFFDGSEGTMLTYEGGGEYLAQTVTGGITVEAWVHDAQPGERSGYVAFFQVAASSFPMHLLRAPFFLASRLCETRDDVDTHIWALCYTCCRTTGAAPRVGATGSGPAKNCCQQRSGTRVSCLALTKAPSALLWPPLARIASTICRPRHARAATT